MDDENYLTEAPTSNIFIINSKGILKTCHEDYVLHGITIDGLGEYIYVSGRGNHKLYKFDAEDGSELLSIPLESDHGTVIAPAGLSIMQSPCINCE